MGDENTNFFHQSIKQRHRANTINVLHVVDEATFDQSRIQEIFQAYYRDLLCTDTKDRRPINMNVIQQGPILIESQHNILSLSFSPNEIKKAL